MAIFERAYQRTLRSEGGYQNNPNDRGNYNSRDELVGTNFGINAQVYEAWIGYPPSERDMRSLLKSTAKRIYKANYWDNIKGDQINNQFLAEIIFDGHVNHGHWGIQLLQEAVGVSKDGVFGPITLAAVNNADVAYLYNTYKQIRIEAYHYLVNRTPSFDVFLNGWLIRINSFNDFPETAISTGSSPSQVESENSLDRQSAMVITGITAIILYLIYS